MKAYEGVDVLQVRSLLTSTGDGGECSALCLMERAEFHHLIGCGLRGRSYMQILEKISAENK